MCKYTNLCHVIINEKLKGKKCHYFFLDKFYASGILKSFRWNWLLTAVAGGSPVATVGAVTVKGAPRLSTYSSMFAVTGGTPWRMKETDREREMFSVFSKVIWKSLCTEQQTFSMPDGFDEVCRRDGEYTKSFKKNLSVLKKHFRGLYFSVNESTGVCSQM